MNNKLSRALNELLFRSFPQLTLVGNPLNNVIIMYHGVDLTGNTRFNMRHAAVKCFEAHIRFLKKYCHIITLADFFSKKFHQQKLNVAITFDDGYQNNYRYALPVLERYQAPASWFITGLNNTDTPAIWADILNIAEQLTYIPIQINDELFRRKNAVYRSENTGITLFETVKKQQPGFGFKQKMVKILLEAMDLPAKTELYDYWKLMSNDEIRESAKSEYIQIGSHGYYHNNLGNLPLEDARQELTLSKSYLENLIQQPVVSLAYPDGSYSKEWQSK